MSRLAEIDALYERLKARDYEAEAFWLTHDALAAGRRTAVWELTATGWVIHRPHGPVRERHQ